MYVYNFVYSGSAKACICRLGVVVGLLLGTTQYFHTYIGTLLLRNNAQHQKSIKKNIATENKLF